MISMYHTGAVMLTIPFAPYARASALLVPQAVDNRRQRAPTGSQYIHMGRDVFESQKMRELDPIVIGRKEALLLTNKGARANVSPEKLAAYRGDITVSYGSWMYELVLTV